MNSKFKSSKLMFWSYRNKRKLFKDCYFWKERIFNFDLKFIWKMENVA